MHFHFAHFPRIFYFACYNQSLFCCRFICLPANRLSNFTYAIAYDASEPSQCIYCMWPCHFVSSHSDFSCRRRRFRSFGFCYLLFLFFQSVLSIFMQFIDILSTAFMLSQHCWHSRLDVKTRTHKYAIYSLSKWNINVSLIIWFDKYFFLLLLPTVFRLPILPHRINIFFAP